HSSVFFALKPRQPRSTLFPYTTLFRSHHARRRRARAGGDRGFARRNLRGLPGGESRAQGGDPERRRRRARTRGRRRARVSRHHGDRKSTRLNSSHLVISYAVFCLKKKK